jgi:uncharacterized protein with GYD domain
MNLNGYCVSLKSPFQNSVNIAKWWTDQGIRNFKDTTRRADAAKREAERIGGKFTIYWTFGEYDAVCILEAPNDEAAMEFGLRVGSLGNVRTTTLRAFTEEEIAKIIGKLG